MEYSEERNDAIAIEASEAQLHWKPSNDYKSWLEWSKTNEGDFNHYLWHILYPTACQF